MNKSNAGCRAAIVTAALGLLFAIVPTRSDAGEQCPPPCGHYEYVDVTRCVEVPCVKVVTLYDHCGRPYRAERTSVRAVEVTVRKRVFVRG